MAAKEKIATWPLFIGGPKNGDQMKMSQRSKFVEIPSVTQLGRKYHLYENMGYAYLYRGLQ